MKQQLNKLFVNDFPRFNVGFESRKFEIVMREIRLELIPLLERDAGVLDGVEEHPHSLLLQIVFRNLKKNFGDSGFETSLACWKEAK